MRPSCADYATATSSQSSTVDLAASEAMACLEQGTQKLEEGDIEGAKSFYKRSVDIKRDAGALFNLGVTHYHLSEQLCLTCLFSPDEADVC